MYLSPPDMGPLEREMLVAAFDSNWVAPVGPDLDAFEVEIQNRVGDVFAVGLSSGTAALHLALLGVGVVAGDDVVVSTFTFAATVNAIKYCGANPIFLDSDRETWNMSPVLLRQTLAERAGKGLRTAAVLCVDLYGLMADYAAIQQICDAAGVPLIEDAAEALGATQHGRNAGSFGAAAAFSFNGNKLITTSSGGMLVSKDPAMISRARYLATQARQKVAHYEHVDIGYNYRLSNLLAALGRAQLKRIDEKIARRKRNRMLYHEVLSQIDGLQFNPIPDGFTSNHWLTCFTVNPGLGVRPEAIQEALEAHDIESRPLWKPMHLQPVFSDCESVLNGVSDDLFASGLCLPSGSQMTDSDVERVASLVRSQFRQ